MSGGQARGAGRVSRARVRPRALRSGDTVAVIAPAGRVEPAALEAGVERLRRRGVRVKVGRHALDRYGHLAGADRDRAADLMEAFLDPGVTAIFCARGGSGSARILPFLDLRAIAARPKIFVGYSDITVLHLVLEHSAGWPTFYGPMVATEFGLTRESECFEALWELITRAEPVGQLALPSGPATPRTLAPGVAEGRLVGGTLCLLESSLGTPYQLRTGGRLLAMEDSHESPWRVDRMLTHLGQLGLLAKAAGFIVGSLADMKPPGATGDLPIEQSLLDHLGALGKPILDGFSFGHLAAPLTLPLNCRARLDADAGVVTVLEPAVCEPGSKEEGRKPR